MNTVGVSEVTFGEKKGKNYIYYGPLLHGKMHGDNGEIHFLDTNIKYKGQFKDDTLTGYGILYYPNGDIYEGGMENGIRHGHGKYTYGNKPGQCFEGNFINGVKEEGSVQFPNGSVFTGDFVDGKPNKGTLAQGNEITKVSVIDGVTASRIE